MKNPVMWVASNYTPQIHLRKVTATDRRFPRATFHETWEEAHAAQLAKAQARLERAGKEAKAAVRAAMSAHNSLKKVEAMAKPDTDKHHAKKAAA